MEWVETTGKSLDEAKAIALDQLGVAEDEAEFEVLEEPKTGLFGRIRGEARVRARVRPTQFRTKPERRDRRRKSAGAPDGDQAATARPDRSGGDRSARDRSGEGRDGNGRDGNGREGNGRERNGGGRNGRPAGERPAPTDTPSAEAREHAVTSVDAQQVGEEARRFVAGLVDAFGMTATTELRGEGTELEVVVDGGDLGLLVGPRGTTLQAVQDLARVASQRRLGDHDTRLRVDIAGYRARRQAALGSFAHKMADEVVASGTARVLEPMGSSDRKAIHDALSDVAGVATRSEGDDPFRRVVIAPRQG